MPGAPSAASPWEEEATVIWSPPDDWDAADDPPPPTPAAAPPSEEPKRPAVEVEVRYITGAAALSGPRKVYELWTRNRVYYLDAEMKCVGVIDLASGRENAKHPFLGAKLVGGQLRREGSNELSFPLPSPGSEAVFQKSNDMRRIRLSLTSAVTRVIVHLQRVKVNLDENDSAWGHITKI